VIDGDISVEENAGATDTVVGLLEGLRKSAGRDGAGVDTLILMGGGVCLEFKSKLVGRLEF
jgi:hypothetical protein